MTERMKILKIIHLSMCVGTILIYFFLGSFSSIENLYSLSLDNLSIFFIGIPILAFILSNFIFKSQLKNADPALSLTDKLPIYQTASISRWAILEGAAIFIVIIKPDFLILGILLILYLIFLTPSEDKLKSDFENAKI